MNLEAMKRKYAYTLARVGLNVQKGQPVLVEAAIEGAYFTPIFAEECYKLGAKRVTVDFSYQPLEKLDVKYCKENVLGSFLDWQRNPL